MQLQKTGLVIVFLFFTTFQGCAQKVNENNIAVAFYNCENFFDTVHNPLKEDEEFTPQGKYHYTQKIYEQKVHNIATVIQSMGGKYGPALVGMAEVENATVLKDLVRQPEIAPRHYKYEWFDGPDPRGINVAMLYNPIFFQVLSSVPIPVDLTGVNGKSITRDVLHVHGVLRGDTVDIFVCHWPSRRGGEDESTPKRAIAARVEKDAVDALMRKNAHAKVILMGDFNDNPDDNSIAEILAAKAEQKEVPPSGLYDPFAIIFKSGAGTEEYRHSWNLFDQVIISSGFLQNRNHRLHYDKAEVFKPDFIIDHYKGHEGEPHRSFVGTHWINGYSDHFPVILYLSDN